MILSVRGREEWCSRLRTSIRSTIEACKMTLWRPSERSWLVTWIPRDTACPTSMHMHQYHSSEKGGQRTHINNHGIHLPPIRPSSRRPLRLIHRQHKLRHHYPPPHQPSISQPRIKQQLTPSPSDYRTLPHHLRRTPARIPLDPMIQTFTSSSVQLQGYLKSETHASNKASNPSSSLSSLHTHCSYPLFRSEPRVGSVYHEIASSR